MINISHHNNLKKGSLYVLWMETCFKCGITGDKVRLFDAITDEGIAKICGECASNEHIPIINKPTEYQLKEAERRQSIYQRFSRSDKTTSGAGARGVVNLGKPETTLRDIVDRNLKFNPKRRELERKPRPDLVDNFHWAIMTARRRTKLSQKQVAKAIGVPESAIAMAEKGILPENDYMLINKLENYLGIILIRGETREIVAEKHEPEPEKKLVFDHIGLKNLTISDLREMKKRKEEEMIRESEKNELRKYTEEELGSDLSAGEDEMDFADGEDIEEENYKED